MSNYVVIEGETLSVKTLAEFDNKPEAHAYIEGYREAKPARNGKEVILIPDDFEDQSVQIRGNILGELSENPWGLEV